MDIPTSREREDLERLEALYDATDGGRTEARPPAALEPLGVAHDDAYLWMRDASRRGLVEVDDGMVPRAKPSSAGRDLVERARQRRADRAARRRGAASRLLAWSDSTGGNVTAFIASEYGWVDGQRLTFDEAVDAARTLDAASLIKARTLGAWGGDVVRCDVSILPAGRDCLDEHDGDVRAYQSAQRASAPSLVIGQMTGALAVGGSGSTNTANYSGLDIAQVRALAEMLVQARGTLGLDDEQLTELDTHVEAMRAGKDDGHMRRALTWVGGLATSTAAGALGQVLAAAAIALLGGGG